MSKIKVGINGFGRIGRLALRAADFHTSVTVAKTINAELLGDFAHSVDPGTVDVIVPPQFQGRVPELVARVEERHIPPE